MSVSRYAFLNGKIGVYKSELLSPEEFKALIESPSAEDLILSLNNTSYSKWLPEGNMSLSELEQVLTQILTKQYNILSYSLTGGAKIFFSRLRRKYEFMALKGLIRVGQEKDNDELAAPWKNIDSISDVPMDRFIEAKNLQEMVEVIQNTEYGEAFRRGFEESRKQGTLSPLLAELDMHFYSKLISAFRMMQGKDRIVTRTLMGMEIDILNIKTAMRLRGAPEEEVTPNYLPYNYLATEKFLRAVNQTKSLASLISEEPDVPYSAIIGKAIKGEDESLLPIENALEKYRLQISRQIFTGERFHIGNSLAYLTIKEAEVRDISAIMKLKQEKMSNEDIESMVLSIE